MRRHAPTFRDLPRSASCSSLLATLMLCALAMGCSDDAKKAKSSADTGTSDSSANVDGQADGVATLPAGKHVGADLTKQLPTTTAKGAYLRAFAQTDAFTGSAAQGREGDWIIGNADVRYVIQGDDRHIGVCPWGGNPLDGSARRADGTWSDDEMGEHCLLFNLGRTLKPEHFEVLADGKKGGPAVLAVTGQDTLLDFINLPSLLSSFPIFGDDLEIPMNPDADVPLTITRYYILAPNERALRVVTAFRNDGDTEVIIGTGELVDSGGEVEFFNPAANSKGFGSGSGGFSAQKLDFIAFRSPRGSHAYAPPPVNGSVGGSYLSIGGAAGILLGTDALLPLLLGGKTKFDQSTAAVRIPAGAIITRDNLVVAGTGDLSSISEAVWTARGVAVHGVTGAAVDAQGNPVVGARISLIHNGATKSQVISDAKGAFSGNVATSPGDKNDGWQVQGWHPSYGVSKLIDAGDDMKLVFGDSGRIKLTVTDKDGKPRPAKVTLYCAEACPEVPATLYDSASDRPGEGAWEAYFVGMDGVLDTALPVGAYRIVVSAGPTHSLWPSDAHTSGGGALTISAGKTTTQAAVLYQAVDTSGWISGDFHVHAVNSPDAQVENRRRVRSFLAEGVDVLVATDHDYVTDMTPYIAAEKAEARLVSIAGAEVTPFDYGHFNCFPIKREASDLAGGALDWAGGAGDGLDPPAIREAMSKRGDGMPAIVQINHPSSYMSAARVDILGGVSYGERATYRVTATPSHPRPDDAKTGNTGMFTDKFDALELLTGHRGGGGFGGDSFPQVVNWWFTLLSRGVRWTGTAVSDAHGAISSQAGGARSFVFVGPKHDTPKTFDMKTFIDAIRAGKVVGCDGPFVRIWAEKSGKKAVVGDTLAVTLGETVTVTVDVQAPYWMDLSRVELYVTPTLTYAPVGTTMGDLPKPYAIHTWTPDEKKLKAGFDVKTQRWHLQAVFELKGDGKDGYAMAMVHGDKALPKPLVAGDDIKPLSFTNPVFLDGDGGGYNNPPLKKTIQAKPAPPPPRKRVRRPPTNEELRAVIHELHHPH